MKRSFLSLFIVGAVLVTGPTQIAVADDGTSVGQAAPSAGSTGSTGDGMAGGAQGQRLERFKEAMAQLDLTDAQKAQIKQIRTTVTDRKERRQQIMGVLTSDQKTKLMQLIQEHKNNGQTAAAAAPNPDGN